MGGWEDGRRVREREDRSNLKTNLKNILLASSFYFIRYQIK